MIVYALVGQSGTGKSHRALLVANEHNIPAIIDDGLLISAGRILAGKSAKKAISKITAIRTALFSDDQHAEEVRNKISQIAPSKILILGTSTGMINKIAARLNLGEPQHFISIEDISSKNEIAVARFKRQRMGTHVVPAPSVEVKKKLSVSLVETFFHKKPQRKNKQHHMENSIVRPKYNSYGHFYIANQAVVQIVKFSCTSIPNVVKLSKVDVIDFEDGMILNIDVEISLGRYLPDIAQEIKEIVSLNVEKMTANAVDEVNIHIKKLHVGKVE